MIGENGIGEKEKIDLDEVIEVEEVEKIKVDDKMIRGRILIKMMMKLPRRVLKKRTKKIKNQSNPWNR